LLALVVSMLYAPVLFATYGMGDDYPVLLGFLRRDLHFPISNELSNGRPGMLALHLLAFPLVDDVSSLRWLRLLTVLGIAAVAVAVARLAVISGRKPWVGMALGLTVAALPSFQIVAAWSMLFVVPPAVLLGLWAARRTDVLGSRSSVAWRQLIGPVAALTAAALIYQPAAMAYWLTIALLVTGPARRLDSVTSSRLRAHVVVVCLAGATTIAVWASLPHDAVIAARSTLGGSPGALGSWFFGGVMPRALFPLSLQPLPMVSTFLATFLVVGLIAASRDRAKKPVVRAGLIMCLIPLSHLPSLVAGPDVRPTYRSMIALAPVLVVLLLHAAEGIAGAMRHSVDGPTARALPALALVVPLVLTLEAPAVTYTYIARPQATEYRLATEATAGISPWAPIATRTTETDTLLARTRFTDEFGQPTSWYSWAVVPMLCLARHDTSGSWGAPVRWSGRGTPAPPGAVLVDFDELLRNHK
jgi:hypothetical protein